MKETDKYKLMDHMAEYGYHMLRPQVFHEPETVLRDLLKQNDVRLLEGFSVVLAGALRKKDKLLWEDVKWRPDNEWTQKVAHRFSVLMGLSYLLFKLFGLNEFADRLSRLLARQMTSSEFKKCLAVLRPSFANSETLDVDDDLELSTERLKNTFRNYVVYAPESKELEKKEHDFQLELLLSQFFTSRQKELLKKRAQNKPMTKTEKEYFYRVVKKRLKALANEELHQMARSLVEK